MVVVIEPRGQLSEDCLLGVRYSREEVTVSPAFDSRDELAFALLRIEAAAKKLIPKPKLATLFKNLRFETAGRLLREY
ncbi:hypothetical protein [Myxococcus sp. CA033]|uniref:hypothetical protein n=1 Tax=Myxococcus sp. CA033 TaxID=2741516 RepID=UPI0020C606AC|nr:hypothetical protein [Myxococcus sp. CA033]